MMSHWIFRSVLGELSREREVIAIDLPGFGESDRPSPDKYNYDGPAFAATVSEVMEKLDVAQADILGHSMGGLTALTLGARHPERVSRLVLICPSVYPLPVQPEHKLIMTRVGPFLFKHLMSKALFAAGWRARHVKNPAAITDELVDHVWARFIRAGGRDAAYAAAVTLSKLSNNTADPGRVRAPTLLVWPEEDRAVPLAHGKRLVRAIPGARLEVVPACGHEVLVERPEELLRVVLPFLNARAEELPAAARAPHLAIAPVDTIDESKQRSAS
jgi:pimeloyl-ACP methyl ester carboxylesterase